MPGIIEIRFEKTQVKQSRIPGAASGLFLTRSVIKGEVIYHYLYYLYYHHYWNCHCHHGGGDIIIIFYCYSY